jgi:hypothetical protein
MPPCQFTDYFDTQVLRKRPFLRKEWCQRIVDQPLRAECQPNGRWRYWGQVPEFGNRYLRVVTLADRVTVHNAFPDRGFKP